MIEYIHGTLAELAPTTAVVEAAGVGYTINISLTTYSALAGKESRGDKQGEDVKIYITEIIREDTHELFGFPTKGEREIFLLLTSVSGVGANTARTILSTYTAAEVRQIVATDNRRSLQQVKGLGKKTVEHIMADLRDKVLKIDLGGDPTELPLENMSASVSSQTKDEAVSALVMLGFNAAASAKAADKILADEPTASVEHIIRLALKML